MNFIAETTNTKPNPAPGADFVQALTAAFTSDDIEYFMEFIVPDGEWAIMATSEAFRGFDQIRQLATRSVVARNHTDGLGIKPTNVFSNAAARNFDGAMCTPEWWPSSSAQRPVPGMKFDLPIILRCEIRQGKLVKVREWLDLLTILEPGTPHHLYS
jgi:hypothetical protein